MFGGDYIHFGIVVGKLRGEIDITLGFVDDLLRDIFLKKIEAGIYFTQDCFPLRAVLPVASRVFTFGICLL